MRLDFDLIFANDIAKIRLLYIIYRDIFQVLYANSSFVEILLVIYACASLVYISAQSLPSFF